MLTCTKHCGGFCRISLKDIVASENAKGWLFFNFRDDQLENLKPIIAAMADIISKTILSMEESKTRKFWMIIDEFASLGRIGSILDFLTKARKNGGRAILGLQTVSQLPESVTIPPAPSTAPINIPRCLPTAPPIDANDAQSQ